jgi:hypothetical protein
MRTIDTEKPAVEKVNQSINICLQCKGKKASYTNNGTFYRQHAKMGQVCHQKR